MLYLNLKEIEIPFWGVINLTLTNVVFESICFKTFTMISNYLTLTNVVFECWSGKSTPIKMFNLTLTNVVFEFTL